MFSPRASSYSVDDMIIPPIPCDKNLKIILNPPLPSPLFFYIQCIIKFCLILPPTDFSTPFTSLNLYH